LGRVVTPQAKLASGNPEEARRAVLEHLYAAAGLEAQLRHPANPGLVAPDIGHIRPFTGAEHIQGQQFAGHYRPNSLVEI